MESLQSWVSDHKPAGIGTALASPIGVKLAPRGRKGGLVALTLTVLSGVALWQYYEFTDNVLERVEELPDGRKINKG